MPLDNAPSAAASYARALMAQGCPQQLANTVAEILARDGEQQRSVQEEELVKQAWSSLKPPAHG